jgi:enterochelin esterase-like enzyme
MMKLFLVCVISIAIASVGQATAQVQTNVPDVVPGAKPVSVEHIKVHGKALEGNLEGDAVDRDVIVFLPPSYDKDKKRRYPVIYALHGFFIGAEQWSHEIHVPQTIEGAFAHGAKEMIVVLPDSKTIYNGSMYSSSATTGDFEKFISQDLITYIDAHYRTMPNRTSRGLVGHSMGGYGASRIGMKHPDVFGALYIMSPCCMSPMGAGGPGPADQIKERAIANEKKVAAAKSPAELATQSPGFGSALLRRLRRGLPIRRTLRCISICRPRMVFRSRRLWPNSRPTHHWPLSTSTSGISSSTVPLQWMWATRMACASMPPSFTTS